MRLLNPTQAATAARVHQRFVYPVDAEGVPLVTTEWAARNKQQLDLWFEEFGPDVEYVVLEREYEWVVNDPAQTWHDTELPGAEESMVRLEQRKLRVQREAKRREAAENYTGGYARLSWADLRNARVDWLVDGLIAEGSLNFLVAKRNTGKSFTYVDLAFSMTTGRDWLGHSTRPAKVFVVLGEGKHGFYERLEAWCQFHGVDIADIEPWIGWAEGVNLSNDYALDQLRADIAEFEPELVVFDTWAATTGIADEKDNSLASEIVRRAREAAQGAAVLFCAHPPHELADTTAPRMRGASSPIDSADMVMTLWRDKDHNTGVARAFLALSTEEEHAGKNRNAPRETVRGLYLESIGNSAVLVRDETKGLNSHDTWCLEHMETGRAYTVAELVEETGFDRSWVAKKVRSRLVAADKTGKAHTYTLTVEKAPRTVAVGAAQARKAAAISQAVAA